jgi:hypothetical protein
MRHITPTIHGTGEVLPSQALMTEGVEGLRKLAVLGDKLTTRHGGCSGCALQKTCGTCMPLANLTSRRAPRPKPTASTAVGRCPRTGKEGGPPVTAVAVELLPAPPASDTLDPDAVELAADSDKIMTTG